MKPVVNLAVSLALCAAPVAALADDQALVMQAILAKWELASHRTTTIDVNFTRLQIDHGGQRQKPVRGHGRFYWESTDRAAYLVPSEVHCVWNGGLLLIDLDRATYLSATDAQHEQAIEQLANFGQLSFFQKLGAIGAVMAAAQLEHVLPLCARVNARSVLLKYKLTWQQHDEGILITAVPKRLQPVIEIQQVDLILDPRDLHVRAHRIIKPNREQTIHLFDSTAINETPPDRDELLAPNLSKFEPNWATLFNQ